MKITRLTYGNTHTYFFGGLLIDTDMPGKMTAFRREMKKHGLAAGDIRYVFLTHCHPDHIGLVGELMNHGAKLLLLAHQVPFVHSSDAIFSRDKTSDFVPIDESAATVISPGESRAFLAGLGIAGRILPTKSHSPDGAALILDDGHAFVGDIEPREFLGGYEDNPTLKADWDDLLRFGARVIHYGHANDQQIHP